MGDRICVMQAGHIMQVADPKTLYNQPENLFVAGFIGSPEMNLIDVELVGDMLTLGAQRIPMPASLKARLSARPANAVLGIRPQHFRPGTPDNALSGRLSHVEFMGHEVNIHVDLGPATVIAVMPAMAFDAMNRSDDNVHLTPDEAEMHIFDKDSEANVSLAR